MRATSTQIVLLFFAIVIAACNSEPNRMATGPTEGAVYTYNGDSTRLEWTVRWKGENEGFTGTFDAVQLSVSADSTTPASALSNAGMEIHAPLIDAGDPKLSSSIVERLFGKEGDDLIIGASVVSLDGTEANGNVEMYIVLANAGDTISMDYTVNDDILELWGTLDLAEIGLYERLEGLNENYGDGKELDPRVDLYFITRFHKGKRPAGSISAFEEQL